MAFSKAICGLFLKKRLHTSEALIRSADKKIKISPRISRRRLTRAARFGVVIPSQANRDDNDSTRHHTLHPTDHRLLTLHPPSSNVKHPTNNYHHHYRKPHRHQEPSQLPARTRSATPELLLHLHPVAIQAILHPAHPHPHHLGPRRDAAVGARNPLGGLLHLASWRQSEGRFHGGELAGPRDYGDE